MFSDIDKVIYESQTELSDNVTRESWRMFQLRAIEQVIRSMNIEQEAVDWFIDYLFSEVNPAPSRKADKDAEKVTMIRPVLHLKSLPMRGR